MRAKRGLTDTSRPGGFCKDQMYLTGALTVLRRRKEIDFRALYMGKVSLDDAERLKREGIAVLDGLKLPVFLQDEEAYRRKLDVVVECNGLSDDVLCT